MCENDVISITKQIMKWVMKKLLGGADKNVPIHRRYISIKFLFSLFIALHIFCIQHYFHSLCNPPRQRAHARWMNWTFLLFGQKKSSYIFLIKYSWNFYLNDCLWSWCYVYFMVIGECNVCVQCVQRVETV